MSMGALGAFRYRVCGLVIAITLALITPPAMAHQRHHRKRRSLDTCPTQLFHVINAAGLDYNTLFNIKWVTRQDSLNLHDVWGVPCAQWGTIGQPVWVEPGPVNGLTGYHAVCSAVWTICNGTTVGTPFGVSYAFSMGSWGGTARAFSHEIFEMLTDPQATNNALEVCDPLQNAAPYILDGIALAPFVTS